MRDYSRLDRFLDKLGADIYPEEGLEFPKRITREGIDKAIQRGMLSPGMKVLDVGCGKGIALTEFKARGIDAVGITLGSDVDACRSMGFDVHEMDQNFTSFPDASFDFLWCRHVLEHSVVPLFTLNEYYRLLKPGQFAYVELPAPDTPAHHEENPNHYSVFSSSSWVSHFQRTGFTMVDGFALRVILPDIGDDQYYCYFLRRDDKPFA